MDYFWLNYFCFEVEALEVVLGFAESAIPFTASPASSAATTSVEVAVVCVDPPKSPWDVVNPAVAPMIMPINPPNQKFPDASVVGSVYFPLL